ncbi:hypothetical protein [Trinickia dabaoshanensis]|uniref:hypothetical protein n=1 Tax=Trinickia dabaoshanensis TaxID=564714 RepID=UPI0011AECFB1|nr:hypothetical protein [Trinickia dabaoshanensis]
MAAIVGLYYWSKPADVVPPARNVHFTFGVSDLYAPFLSPSENADVLSHLPEGAEVSATYQHTTYSYSLLSCMIGVACLPDPHWHSDTKEEIRLYPAKIEPYQANGKTRSFSVDLPQTLPGGYALEKLYLSVSADTFYRQPSYSALVAQTEKGSKSSLDDLKTPPAFEYLVSYLDHDLPQDVRYDQDCLDVMTPLRFPTVPIPVVTRITSDSNRMGLMRISSRSCPLIDSDLSDAPGFTTGKVPLSRVAASQSSIDFDGVAGATILSGRVTATEDMTRWQNEGKDGVGLYLVEFGPFRQLEVRSYPDSARPSKHIRIETWTFFDDALVGYSGEVFYPPADGADSDKTVQWKEYFHDGKPVWMQTTPAICDTPDCQSVLTEVNFSTTRPYGELQSEARSYLRFKGVLKPVDKNG